MAGWSSLFGENNPLATWANSNRSLLGAIGGGLGSGTTFGEGLGIAASQVGPARIADDAYAVAQKKEADAAEQMNRTNEYLRSTAPDLFEKVQAGLPVSQAWDEAMRREQGVAQVQPMEINGQLVDPSTGSIIGDYRDPQSGMPAAPSGYQYTPDGGLAFIPGGPADPSAKPNVAMSATTQKELFEAEDAATAGGYVLSALDEAVNLNAAAYDGPFADKRGEASALIGDQFGVATSRLKNVTTELALSQLKTVFGSMPTEGERKILLELQGSVNQPREVRAAIYKRAKEMALRRIEDSRRKADALRSGAYFEPGFGPVPNDQTQGSVTQSGVTYRVVQ